MEEEEWLWGRQQLLGEIPTHPMKGTGLGKKKEDDEADTRPVGKTERETRGSVYPVGWGGLRACCQVIPGWRLRGLATRRDSRRFGLARRWRCFEVRDLEVKISTTSTDIEFNGPT